MKVLVFDTETTGLPPKKKNKFEKTPTIFDGNYWPRIVEIAWSLHETAEEPLTKSSYLVKPKNFVVPEQATQIHGISHKQASEEGLDIGIILEEFVSAVKLADVIVAHNLDFDMNTVQAELARLNNIEGINTIRQKNCICTMKSSVNYCRIPGKFNKYKWPSLSELHRILFGREMQDAHRAGNDVTATMKCFFQLKQLEVIR